MGRVLAAPDEGRPPWCHRGRMRWLSRTLHQRNCDWCGQHTPLAARWRRRDSAGGPDPRLHYRFAGRRAGKERRPCEGAVAPGHRKRGPLCEIVHDDLGRDVGVVTALRGLGAQRPGSQGAPHPQRWPPQHPCGYLRWQRSFPLEPPGRAALRFNESGAHRHVGARRLELGCRDPAFRWQQREYRSVGDGPYARGDRHRPHRSVQV
mmetsp:Transcript_79857/g.222363  ORF Transcript_79857/g.222363 Transcript_79857/m.222363 type:complete len:206 (-) Transcript_79857:1784-2401(-)